MFQVLHMILRNFIYNYVYIEKIVIIHFWYISFFIRERKAAELSTKGQLF